MPELMTKITEIWTIPGVRELTILCAAGIAALLVRFGFSRILTRLTAKTRTSADDDIIEACRGPLVSIVFLIGVGWALAGLNMPERPQFVLLAIVKSLGIIYLSLAATRVTKVLLGTISRQVDRISFIQPKTVPLLEMMSKIGVFGASVYFVFVAWNIDLTTWLASAGIIGIAVGFAAKDTLANLFSGIFIVADAPYKPGDFIILDNSLRGVVVDIGIRSTRLLTRDDIEVIVPNAVIAGSKIVNETSGRHQKMRVRVNISVAYGSDVDEVRRILMECSENVEHAESDPEPRVRFREFGDSGLNFQLMVWISEPIFRGRVLDVLNTRVYKALNAAGIEIPYPKTDVYIKEQPPAVVSETGEASE